MRCLRCGRTQREDERWPAAACGECWSSLRVAQLQSAHVPVLSWRLDAHPEAPGKARGAVDQLRVLLADEPVETLRLLVSELVTNSVEHAGQGPIGLDVWLSGATVRVRVTDAGEGFTPSPRTPGQDLCSGWGLALVDTLADRWGTSTSGTCVWFELEVADAQLAEPFAEIRSMSAAAA